MPDESSRDPRDLRELYERATDFSTEPWSERPFFGGPAAPAQAETNVGEVWGHINAGYLYAYEHSRWWSESRALRETAILGDWSWLGKTRVAGPDAAAFMAHATVRDCTSQAVGQVMFTPMVNEAGQVAVEGLTFRLAEDAFLFTQSGGYSWLRRLAADADFDVELTDVTPDYTVYAVQGPASRAVVEAVAGDAVDLGFSRFTEVELLGTEALLDRQGVTGEEGYEFLMRTDTGRGADLWRAIRDAGAEYGLRELGFRAQLIGHTESGYPTALRDYLPARVAPEDATRFFRHWSTEEEIDALDWPLADQFCSPAELGWGRLVDLDHAFHGRPALVAAADDGGPAHRYVGLVWDGDDLADLYAAQFRDPPSAPPPSFPPGPFRLEFLPVTVDGDRVGWASGQVYSPTLRRMLSNGRLRREHAEPGTIVTVEWGGFTTEPVAPLRAEVVEQPIIQSADHRP